jgi:hypothetical protein
MWCLYQFGYLGDHAQRGTRTLSTFRLSTGPLYQFGYLSLKSGWSDLPRQPLASDASAPLVELHPDILLSRHPGSNGEPLAFQTSVQTIYTMAGYVNGSGRIRTCDVPGGILIYSQVPSAARPPIREISGKVGS